MKSFNVQKIVSLLISVILLISSCKKVDSDTVPIIQTLDVTNITQIDALCGGSISSESGSTVISRGVCWSQSTTPTILDKKTVDGAGVGTFTSTISGLVDNTKYFVRAYATNNSGTGYGMTMSFTTPPALIPSLTTSEVSNITSSSAKCGGNVLTDGGAVAILDRGVCWSTSSNPTINSSKISAGTGKGLFTCSLENLIQNTTYYVRAYATNSAGTSYGNEKVFMTTSTPTLSTKSISSITSYSAICGGIITNDGRSQITSCGVCWSTNENPTISLDTKTVEIPGTGDFSSTISGLNLGVTYYVRAYATNNVGTAYGNQITFTTTITIGQNYQGGKVAYIFKAGDSGFVSGEIHGLIVTSTDIATGVQWNIGSNIITGATSTAIGTGNSNTNLIVNAHGPGNYAAKICSDYEFSGYSDWYLPSKDEWLQLYNSSGVISFEGTYWSSTEVDVDNAKSQNMMGYSLTSSKQNSNNIRAMRIF